MRDLALISLGVVLGGFGAFVIRDVYLTVFVRTRGVLDHTRLSRGRR